MTVLITLTTAGTDTGPFDLYSNVDVYTVPFETNVNKAVLEAGYSSALVPDSTVTIRVKSVGECVNYIDIPLVPLTTTTTTSILNCGAQSYSYSVERYNCNTCSFIDNINMSNTTPLTIGKYYNINLNYVYKLITFIGCSASPGLTILDVNKKDNCALAACPTTTTTTTV